MSLHGLLLLILALRSLLVLNLSLELLVLLLHRVGLIHGPAMRRRSSLEYSSCSLHARILEGSLELLLLLLLLRHLLLLLVIIVEIKTLVGWLLHVSVWLSRSVVISSELVESFLVIRRRNCWFFHRLSVAQEVVQIKVSTARGLSLFLRLLLLLLFLGCSTVSKKIIKSCCSELARVYHSVLGGGHLVSGVTAVVQVLFFFLFLHG